MANGERDLLIGLALGAILVLAVVIYFRVGEDQQSSGTEPSLVEHNVVRNEQGLIDTVQTYRGLDSTSRPQTRPASQPALEGPETEMVIGTNDNE